ncbi:MAG: glycoside hydrolase family 108 protein, partial [Algicola sp.]|nr:glycoside hydrolase family 108 protein [Algicola sp.]
MNKNFVDSLELVLAHEGGYSDHPRDPGGATMKGVTLAVFRRFYGANQSKEDLKNITKEQLQEIYKIGYWDKCQCDDLPPGVDYGVFDAAVNSGPGRGVRWLQGAVSSDQDGGMGPNTMTKVLEHNPLDVIEDMTDFRITFLRRLSTWPDFGKGWTRRVREVRQIATTLCKDQTPEASVVTPSEDFETVRKG